MVIGGNFATPDQTNLDKGITEANGNFETDGERKFLGIIAIRAGDLLISGSGGFTEYISWEMKV